MKCLCMARACCGAVNWARPNCPCAMLWRRSPSITPPLGYHHHSPAFPSKWRQQLEQEE